MNFALQVVQFVYHIIKEDNDDLLNSTWYWHEGMQVVMIEQEENINLASTQLSGDEFDGITRTLSVDEILKLESDKEEALMQVTPEHPTVVLIERNLDKARATLIAQVQINIDKYRKEKDAVIGEINKLLEELDLLPLFEAEYLRLKRDYEVKSSFYNNLLDRKASFTLSRAVVNNDNILVNMLYFMIILYNLFFLYISFLLKSRTLRISNLIFMWVLLMFCQSPLFGPYRFELQVSLYHPNMFLLMK